MLTKSAARQNLLVLRVGEIPWYAYLLYPTGSLHFIRLGHVPQAIASGGVGQFQAVGVPFPRIEAPGKVSLVNPALRPW
jgi:hypothetical protein